MPKRRYKPLMYSSKRHKNRILSHNYIELSNDANGTGNELPNTDIDEEEISGSENVTVENNSFTLNLEKADESLNYEPVFFSDESCNGSSDESISMNEELFLNNETFEKEDPSQVFPHQLAAWAIGNNIAHSHLNQLLGILKEHKCFSNLPKDSRTLLNTPRSNSFPIRSVYPGQYFHFGIEKGIIEILKQNSKIIEQKRPDFVKLHINIDGLPIAKSSTSQFWPILCAIPEVDKKPELIAAYHGLSKPGCSNDFLKEFVLEANNLIDNGLVFQDRRIDVQFSAVVCDAPARAFVKKIKGHNAYFGCDRCHQKGYYIENRVTYPEINAPIRTHNSFVSHEQEEHHNGDSIIENVKHIDLINSFPHDYMHLVCLGAMKKLVLLWMRGKLPIRCSAIQINEISSHLLQVAKVMPNDFARKPRSLREIDRWKATEFRQLLLYTGPLVLKSIRKKYFTHFLALTCAIRMLINQNDATTTAKTIEAHKLIEYFVHYYPELYGPEQMSYNVHSLTHLVDDVRNFGSLDEFSAFKFENYLQELKRCLRGNAMPLQQLIRRITENREIGQLKKQCTSSEVGLYPVPENPHFDGPLVLRTSNPQFKKLRFEEFTVCLAENDNCVVLKNGVICIVENIAMFDNNIVIIGREFVNVVDFFKNPISSSKVGIFKANNLSQEKKLWSVSLIKNKAIKIQMDEGNFYVAALIHS